MPLRYDQPEQSDAGNSYADVDLICCDCGRSFTFHASEQRFYRETLGFTTTPRRCRDCRACRKAARE